jgi:4-hydroxy-L-threonine phosphate dehydrogenase PdxA
MIPVKCLSFGEAVNVTLGCRLLELQSIMEPPLISPAKVLAEHSSMVAAIKLAADLSTRAGKLVEQLKSDWKVETNGQ